MVADLAVDPHVGLSPAEAARRLAEDGPNRIVETARRSRARVLLDQFTDFMVLVLLGAAVVAGFVGEPQDTVAIMAIVVLNAALGFVQEDRAERAVAALKALAAPQARVRRGDAVLTVAAAELVRGDVVLLEAGNAVPADLRLVEGVQLRIDESAITGESHPVEKTTDALPDLDLAIGDRRNLAYKGTHVTHGRGAGVVVATGMATELGRIAALLGVEEVKTPLQKRLTALGKQLAVAVLALCAVIFAIGLLRGEAPVLMFLTALSLAVAAIPEALPAVVTIGLAFGARTMAAERALVRRLPAVETLGSVTVICTDKTGTLTENRMRVSAFHVSGADVRDGSAEPASYAPDGSGEPASRAPRSGAPESGEPWSLLLTALALSNDATHGAHGETAGDPTEVALLIAAAEGGREKRVLERRMPRVAELPFSSERARMTTVHADEGGLVAFTKGAPEQVLTLCRDELAPGGHRPLSRGAILEAADAMAADGLRVLAVACRRLASLPTPLSAETVEHDATFLGLVGLFDPPRPEVPDAVALCQSAGIRVVMITGDHPVTARAIARRLGIGGDQARTCTGEELAALAPQELAARVGDVDVYARVAPEQKITLVEALQARGEFVAMTGDGVNDAPALRRAEIGVAMGRSGTDVAREAAHMVLLDDNFATIVSAVREGRRIYDNIRKFVRYVLTGNAAEMWTLFLAPLMQLPVPLLPIHILWVNLVTDGLPGLALALEPVEPGVMRRPPRPPRESVFAHGLGPHVVWVGLLIAGVTLAAQAWAFHSGHAHWQTMTFTVITLAQMAHVLAIRSERESLFRQGLLSNPALLGAVVLTFALQLATFYVPALNPIFKTEPLTALELVICLALSAVAFAGVEGEKWMIRRGWLYASSVGRPAPRASSP